jgi:hypothetical protein
MEHAMSTDILKTIYAGAVETNDVVWDAEREEKRTAVETKQQIWGGKLAASSVGELIAALNGLQNVNRSSSGQIADYFSQTQPAGNVLSLNYHNPQGGWTGEIIKVDLTVSDDGAERWGTEILNGIYKKPHSYGPGLMAEKTFGDHQRVEHADERAAYHFLENYIQSHGCAQTLRDVIARHIKLEEQRQAPALALDAK